MYSHLDPIFKTHIRQAETADTGLHIRQDDPRQNGKKNDRQQKNETDNSLWEDSAGVSVGALRTFLEDLIRPHQKSAHTVQASINETEFPEENPERPISPQAATAAKAYQHSAETAGTTTRRIMTHTVTPPSESDTKLTGKEIETIQRLIADLENLPPQTNLQLSLKPGTSFLQSLIDAVARYHQL